MARVLRVWKISRASVSQGDASQAEKIFANAGDMHRYYVDERSAVA